MEAPVRYHASKIHTNNNINDSTDKAARFTRNFFTKKYKVYYVQANENRNDHVPVETDTNGHPFYANNLGATIHVLIHM